MDGKPVLVRGLNDALVVAGLAARLGVAVVLVPPPGGGAAWFAGLLARARAAAPAARLSALMPCGEAPGLVLAALAAGLPDVVHAGPAAPALAALGARIHPPPEAVLDPWGARDPAAALGALLLPSGAPVPGAGRP